MWDSRRLPWGNISLSPKKVDLFDDVNAQIRNQQLTMMLFKSIYVALTGYLCMVPFVVSLSVARQGSGVVDRKSAIAALVGAVTATSLFQPGLVSAEEDLALRDRIASRLRVVPTFTIVDKAGVPYMVVGEDAKVTAYFFVSYPEAKRILDAASESAEIALKEAKSKDSNPWKSARISTVPLDTAVSLALQSGSGSIRNYFQVEASPSDIEDALRLSKLDDIAEGKVPLFYYPDFEIDGSTPVYFALTDMEAAFKRTNPKADLPEPKTSELFSLLQEMASNNPDLQNVVFVAPRGSQKSAKDCERKGGKNPPFVLGERNIIL